MITVGTVVQRAEANIHDTMRHEPVLYGGKHGRHVQDVLERVFRYDEVEGRPIDIGNGCVVNATRAATSAGSARAITMLRPPLPQPTSRIRIPPSCGGLRNRIQKRSMSLATFNAIDARNYESQN